MIKRIIFDLDGTLVDTLGGIAGACNYVLRKNGYNEVQIAKYSDYVGNGLAMTLIRALPSHVQREFINEQGLSFDDLLNKDKGDIQFDDNHKIQDYINELIEFYSRHPLMDTSLYEGIIKLLDTLDVLGIEWGIHTNKSKSIAVKISDHYFHDRKYLGLEGPSKTTARKPDPQGSELLLGSKFNKDEVLFIGDTEVDMMTAKNLGVKGVSVTWGFREKEYLKSLEADFLIDEPKDILSIIDTLNKE